MSSGRFAEERTNREPVPDTIDKRFCKTKRNCNDFCIEITLFAPRPPERRPTLRAQARPLPRAFRRRGRRPRTRRESGRVARLGALAPLPPSAFRLVDLPARRLGPSRQVDRSPSRHRPRRFAPRPSCFRQGRQRLQSPPTAIDKRATALLCFVSSHRARANIPPAVPRRKPGPKARSGRRSGKTKELDLHRKSIRSQEIWTISIPNDWLRGGAKAHLSSGFRN